MIRNNEYLGRLECQVREEIIVGMPCTITLKYHVGKYGIDDGGTIQFVRQGLTDWQDYQTHDEMGLGYSSVKTTGDAKLKFLKNAEGVRPFENSIRLGVYDGCLKEGDVVELVLGDREFGSPGILAQSFVESGHKILLMVAPFGGNRYEEVLPLATLEIKNGICGDFHLVLPSTVEVDEPFNMKIRVIDDYGNRCSDFEGSIRLSAPKGFHCQEEIVLTREDNGAKTIECRVDKEGIYRIKGYMDTYELSTVSNSLKTVSKESYKLYWGDMHGQNNVGGGIGDMDEFLSFAKEIGALDFTGWQGNDFEISDENWDTVNKYVKRYHKPGEFVPFLGYEWSGVSSGGGDHNIYFLNDDEKIHRTSQWLFNTGEGYVGYGKDSDGSDCYPITKLWDKYRGREDVMAIPHIGGRHANLDYFDPDFISMIEIHSHHGTFEWFIEEAMKRNLKVGFIGTSDDHSCRMGLSYPVVTFSDDFGATFDVKSGLTAVYAKDLSRESLWEAFKARRCYATTASRILLEYDIDGFQMGSEINLSKKPELNIKVCGNAPLDHVEIYRGTDMIKRINTTSVQASRKKRVKLVWSGVRTRYRKKSVLWDGKVFVKNGKIVGAEDYAIDKVTEGIISHNSHVVSFKSKTSGDEDGMILDIIPNDNCKIIFNSTQKTFEIDLDKLGEMPLEYFVGPENIKVEAMLEAERVGDSDFSKYDHSFTFVDEDVRQGLNQYYFKVIQKDGNRAWASPIFVNYSS